MLGEGQRLVGGTLSGPGILQLRPPHRLTDARAEARLRRVMGEDKSMLFVLGDVLKAYALFDTA